MFRPALLLIVALPLAACGGGSNSTTITVDASSDADGNAIVTADKDGRVAINAQGFQGSITLPKIAVTAENLDLDGVNLYPGSQVRDLHIEARNGQASDDKGEVRLAFESPAPLAKVQAWFREDLAKNGARVQAKGDGFQGTTRQGDPFTVELAAKGGDAATGKMALRNE